MSFTHQELRKAFANFWEKKNHRAIPPAPLVLKKDPTTLFTSSGMQPIVRYLEGVPHPLGKRLYNIQPCFRAVDIDEIGDNRHTTFFEMMGNWSLGDYFKKEQLEWCWSFFLKELKLPKERLHITVFEGGSGVARDVESATTWEKLGLPDDHIHYYDATKNWWSRAGTPNKMPAGEIGGPDSEVFYEFTDVPHDKKFGERCHPNCDCGRFLEIGNSVFIQFRRKADGTLEELPQKNVDYGGGLERILAAVNDVNDIFQTNLFSKIIASIETITKKSYEGTNEPSMQIIADHMKAATFFITDGVMPSNKQQGYMLRRLIRRSIVKLHQLKQGEVLPLDLTLIADSVTKIYGEIYFPKKQAYSFTEILTDEVYRFGKSLHKGIQLINQLKYIDGKTAFDLYQNHGFPLELTRELAEEKGQKIDVSTFEEEFKRHQELSRSSSAGMFKGGLADHSEQVLKYHTATHLLHQALRDVLGGEVRQEGSNITGERLRFDFSLSRKPTDEEMQKVETIINGKIKDALPVHFEIMPKSKADQIGALSFFREKYGNEVKIYFVGGSTGSPQDAYSKEFCGGPHVKNTSEIGSVKITRLKKIGANLMRVYAE